MLHLQILQEEKRTAGLDIIIRINESEEGAERKSRYTAIASLIEAPTSREKILLERIGGDKTADEVPALYSETDDFTPEVDDSSWTARRIL